METRKPHFHVDQLRLAIQQEYSEVAQHPSCTTFHFLSGPPLAERLGYDAALLEGVPEGATASFAGVGNPFTLGAMPVGATVLDVGSGAGQDALVAARQVGPRGQVIGVDMTAAMVERATAHAQAARLTHVRFVQGLAEALPVPDAAVDVVISNGVINLCPDKPAVFAEIYRVLRSGGRFQIADTLLDQAVPVYVKDLIHLWTDCVAGGVPQDDYVGMLRAAGFEEVTVSCSYETFRDAPVEQQATRYGARGGGVKGIKP